MTKFTLYHGKDTMADSINLEWIHSEAMRFHGSKWAADVFILPGWA